MVDRCDLNSVKLESTLVLLSNALVAPAAARSIGDRGITGRHLADMSDESELRSLGINQTKARILWRQLVLWKHVGVPEQLLRSDCPVTWREVGTPWLGVESHSMRNLHSLSLTETTGVLRALHVPDVVLDNIREHGIAGLELAGIEHEDELIGLGMGREEARAVFGTIEEWKRIGCADDDCGYVLK